MSSCKETDYKVFELFEKNWALVTEFPGLKVPSA